MSGLLRFVDPDRGPVTDVELVRGGLIPIFWHAQAKLAAPYARSVAGRLTVPNWVRAYHSNRITCVNMAVKSALRAALLLEAEMGQLAGDWGSGVMGVAVGLDDEDISRQARHDAAGQFIFSQLTRGSCALKRAPSPGSSRTYIAPVDDSAVFALSLMLRSSGGFFVGSAIADDEKSATTQARTHATMRARAFQRYLHGEQALWETRAQRVWNFATDNVLAAQTLASIERQCQSSKYLPLPKFNAQKIAWHHDVNAWRVDIPDHALALSSCDTFTFWGADD